MLSEISKLSFRNRNAGRRRRMTGVRVSQATESCEVRILPAVYSIDPIRGNDANPGTLELPFRTPANLSWGTGTANHRNLEAGDTVYLRDGIHDWSGLLAIPQEYEYNAAFLIRSVDGTEAAPVTIQAFPGERPIVKAIENGVENSAIYVLQSEHVKILGLEVTGTFGPGIQVAAASEIEIANNYIHDIDGLQINNIAGIYALSVIGLNIHDNLLHDNYDRGRVGLGQASANNRNIVVFGDGSDHVRVHHNKVFNTPYADGREVGAGIWVKHASEIVGASIEISNNIIRNVDFASIGGQSPGIHAHHNLIVDAAPYHTGGGDNLLTRQLALHDIRIEHNTFVNSDSLAVNALEDFNYPETGMVTFRNNIVQTNTTAYNQDNGILTFDVYGPDSGFQRAITPANLQFAGNVYFNAPTPPQFSVFSANGGRYGSLGANYQFNEWQALSIDTGSVVANPQLDSSFNPQNAAATGAGWLSSDEPRLTMYVEDDLLKESEGINASSVVLIRSGTNPAGSLTVSLSVSDPTEIRLPQTVTFPAGVSVLRVPIEAIDDGINEPTRAVRISGTTTSGLTSSEWVRVIQDEATSLSAPQLNAPTSPTSNMRPMVTWTAVSGAASYEIWISNLSTGAAPAHTGTATGTTYSPQTDLGIGRYRVWVRAVAANGQKSGWSAPRDFVISTPVGLNTPVSQHTTSRPAIQWSPLQGAVKYDVWMNNETSGQTAIVRNQNVTATAFTPSSDLPLGRYRVWVRGIDAAGTPASWSVAKEFSIVVPPVPVSATSSGGFQFSSDFETQDPAVWSIHHTNTSGFNPQGAGGFEWLGYKDNLSLSTSGGRSGTKSLQATYRKDEDLAQALVTVPGGTDFIRTKQFMKFNATYDFGFLQKIHRVQAFDPVSDRNFFDIVVLAGGRARPGFSERDMTGVNELKTLSVNFNGGPFDWGAAWSEDMTLARDVWHELVTEIQLNDPGMANGSVRLFLNGTKVAEKTGVQIRSADHQKINTVMFGGWYSNGAAGQNPARDPASPTTLLIDDVSIVTTNTSSAEPAASTFDRTPEFRWSTPVGAVTSELFLRNMNTGATTLHQQNITGNSWTPSSNLADGPYRWWVRSSTANGFRSVWSAPIDVHIGGRSSVLTPSGTTSDQTPTFSWQRVDGAATYQLWVNRVDAPANVINLSGLTTTNFIPTTALSPGSYRAWVRAVSSTGEISIWSLPRTFQVT